MLILLVSRQFLKLTKGAWRRSIWKYIWDRMYTFFEGFSTMGIIIAQNLCLPNFPLERWHRKFHFWCLLEGLKEMNFYKTRMYGFLLLDGLLKSLWCCNTLIALVEEKTKYVLSTHPKELFSLFFKVGTILTYGLDCNVFNSALCALIRRNFRGVSSSSSKHP